MANQATPDVYYQIHEFVLDEAIVPPNIPDPARHIELLRA